MLFAGGQYNPNHPATSAHRVFRVTPSHEPPSSVGRLIEVHAKISRDFGLEHELPFDSGLSSAQGLLAISFFQENPSNKVKFHAVADIDPLTPEIETSVP